MRDQAQQTFYKTLGARIRGLRGSKLTQEELAKAAKLSRTSIVNIEAGRQNLLVHNLFQICNALNVRPTELLAQIEPPTSELPEINVTSDADAWVRRSLKKAIRTKSPL